MRQIFEILGLWFFLTLALSVSTSAQTWFTEHKPEPVRMLKELFRSPKSEWTRILDRNRSVLDDRFFEDVEKRVVWGLEEGHVDDALRFALVRDMAGQLQGRATNFRELVQALLRNDLEEPVEPFIHRFDDSANSTNISITVLLGEKQVEVLAPWRYWPDSNPTCRKQKDLIATLFRAPTSHWERVLQENRDLLDDRFLELADERVDVALKRGENDLAVYFALLGDSAASIKQKKRTRLGLRVTRWLGGAPLVLDPRDGVQTLFPGANRRPAESLVPWIEN